MKLEVTKEMLKSDDLGDHFRINSDSRDLNYDKYFSAGHTKIKNTFEYNSSNTELLSKEQLIQILLKLPAISSELN